MAGYIVWIMKIRNAYTLVSIALKRFGDVYYRPPGYCIVKLDKSPSRILQDRTSQEATRVLWKLGTLGASILLAAIK